MRYLLFSLLICLSLAATRCQHDAILPPDPDPIDTTTHADTIDCEDTIDIWLPGKMENGYFKAVKTCRDWLAAATASLSGDRVKLKAHTYYALIQAPDTILLQAETFYATAPFAVGKYPMTTHFFIPGKADVFFLDKEHDVILASWSVDTTATDNEIEITEIDAIGKRIKGRFTVNLVLDPFTLDAEKYPARLRFFNGEFDVKLPD